MARDATLIQDRRVSTHDISDYLTRPIIYTVCPRSPFCHLPQKLNHNCVIFNESTL